VKLTSGNNSSSLGGRFCVILAHFSDKLKGTPTRYLPFMLLISNRKRFFFLFGLIGAALLGSTFAFTHQLEAVMKDQAQEANTLTVLTQGHRLMEDLEMAETGQRGYLLTSSDTYLNPYFKGVDDANATLTLLRDTIKHDPRSVVLIDRIDSTKDLKFIELEHTIILNKDGNPKAALNVVEDNSGVLYMKQLRGDVGELMAIWRSYQIIAVAEEHVRVILSMIAFLCLAFLVVGILAWSLWIQRAAYEEIEAHVEHLDHQTTHDPLTSLYNRRKLLSDIDALSEANAHPVGLIYIDIDGFKSVNDTMGHLEGDRLLKKLASSFATVVRSTDTLARIGGDEFVFLIPNYQDDTQLIEIAKRIIKNVEALSKAEYKGLIDASIGIATYSSRVQSIHDLLGAADGAMYKSKRSGRGRYNFSEKL